MTRPWNSNDPAAELVTYLLPPAPATKDQIFMRTCLSRASVRAVFPETRLFPSLPKGDALHAARGGTRWGLKRQATTTLLPGCRLTHSLTHSPHGRAQVPSRKPQGSGLLGHAVPASLRTTSTQLSQEGGATDTQGRMDPRSKCSSWDRALLETEQSPGLGNAPSDLPQSSREVPKGPQHRVAASSTRGKQFGVWSENLLGTT